MKLIKKTIKIMEEREGDKITYYPFIRYSILGIPIWDTYFRINNCYKVLWNVKYHWYNFETTTSTWAQGVNSLEECYKICEEIKVWMKNSSISVKHKELDYNNPLN